MMPLRGIHGTCCHGPTQGGVAPPGGPPHPPRRSEAQLLEISKAAFDEGVVPPGDMQAWDGDVTMQGRRDQRRPVFVPRFMLYPVVEEPRELARFEPGAQ